MRQRISVDVIVLNLACCSLRSYAGEVAAKLFLQMRLPRECFLGGMATHTPPSFALPARKVTPPPVTGVLQLRVSQERIGFV